MYKHIKSGEIYKPVDVVFGGVRFLAIEAGEYRVMNNAAIEKHLVRIEGGQNA